MKKKCNVNFYVIIPVENSNNYFKLTHTHFKDKRLIAKYDQRWRYPYVIEKFCSLLWMKGNTVIANTAVSTSIEYMSTDLESMDINTSSSSSTHSIQPPANKKRRVEIDITGFNNQEEDNNDFNNSDSNNKRNDDLKF